MSTLTEEQARAYMHKLLATMVRGDGSDLFISADFPPSMKSHGSMQPLATQKLNAETTRLLAQAMMNPRQREEFAKEMECNFAISLPEVSRFREIGKTARKGHQHPGIVTRVTAAGSKGRSGITMRRVARWKR